LTVDTEATERLSAERARLKRDQRTAFGLFIVLPLGVVLPLYYGFQDQATYAAKFLAMAAIVILPALYVLSLLIFYAAIRFEKWWATSRFNPIAVPCTPPHHAPLTPAPSASDTRLRAQVRVRYWFLLRADRLRACLIRRERSADKEDLARTWIARQSPMEAFGKLSFAYDVLSDGLVTKALLDAGHPDWFKVSITLMVAPYVIVAMLMVVPIRHLLPTGAADIARLKARSRDYRPASSRTDRALAKAGWAVATAPGWAHWLAAPLYIALALPAVLLLDVSLVP
jgi:hypothetical protein